MRKLIASDDAEGMRERLDTDPRLLHLATPLGGWLHMAASSGATRCAEELLRRGVDVNGRYDSQLGGALNEAANSGDLEMVNLLLASGAVPDTSHTDVNPVFSAIRAERTDIAERLVDAGLDPHVEYQKGWTAARYAEEQGKAEMARFVRELGS